MRFRGSPPPGSTVSAAPIPQVHGTPDATPQPSPPPRLAWNAARRAQWAAETEPWLDPALTGIEGALGAHDASALLAAAPDTDSETAAALAELPRAFIERLTLDMVLGGDGEERLLIGSVREDGAIYVLALCRLDGGGACALRRFLLVSLLG